MSLTDSWCLADLVQAPAARVPSLTPVPVPSPAAALRSERERIAMDLHDGVIQSLFAVGLSLTGREAETDTGSLRRCLTDAVTSLDDTITDLRRYVSALRGTPGGPRQLVEDLQAVADQFGVPGVDISVRVDPWAASLLAGRAETIVNAAREAVSNAVRHGRPRSVWIALEVEARQIVLEVADDGCGFDPDAAAKGSGLSNLARRAANLGGSLELRSRDGLGTIVRLVLVDGSKNGAHGVAG